MGLPSDRSEVSSIQTAVDSGREFPIAREGITA